MVSVARKTDVQMAPAVAESLSWPCHFYIQQHDFALCYAGPLLQAAAQLIRHFPVFRDIVVSVARKTDAQMWPALFAAVGSPGALLEALLDVGALQSAACCLLIVDRIQGAQEAHGLALRLIQVMICILRSGELWQRHLTREKTEETQKIGLLSVGSELHLRGSGSP